MKIVKTQLPQPPAPPPTFLIELTEGELATILTVMGKGFCYMVQQDDHRYYRMGRGNLPGEDLYEQLKIAK